MALALKDRVQQQGTANTTVSFTLTASVAGFQSFAAVGNGNTTYYTATDIGGNWEVGIGTYSTTGPTITRDTILSSSNSGSAVTFSGTVNVWVDYPAGKSVNLNADGVAEIGEPVSYADTGIIGTFASTVAGYNQVIVQNKSTATNASSNLNVSNDASTASTGFAELGINSSTFSNGAGCFNIPGAAYVASAGTDLSIGTYGAYDIHFATNSNTVDSMTIHDNGGVALGGYGNPGIGNLAVNKIVSGVTTITSSAGTTVLDAASTYYQVVVGTTTQTIQLPDATTLLNGTTFIIDNDSTGNVTVTDNASASLDVIPAGGIAYLYLSNNSTVAGSWTAHGFLPSIYNFNNSTADFANATITNAVWNGTTIASGYGGTGLTTFVAANNALYSTGASTLTAGTLPVEAGGTGLTSLTADYIPYGNGTSAYQSSSTFTFNGTTLSAPSASLSGNLTFTGTGNRITGDFTNATIANRVILQSSTTNGVTGVWAIPNGTAQISAFAVSNSSDPANASIGSITQFSTDFRISNSNSGTGSTLPMTFYTGGSERMRIDTSGNVGIGMNNPAFLLDINGSGAVRSASGFNFYNSDNTNFYYILNSGATGSSNGVLTFTQGGVAERMRIDSSGNVGIGTSSPAGKLNVYDATASAVNIQGDAATNLTVARFSTDTVQPNFQLRKSRGTLASPAAVASGDTLGAFSFQGYGGTTNRNLVTIAGYVDTYTSDTDISSYVTFGTSPSGSAASTERMRIDSAGNIGIGTNAPAVSLDVVGTFRSTSVTIADAATITPTSDTTNQYTVTALAQAATIAVPSGTPIDGQKLTIRIKDDGTARALTWTTTSGGYRVIGTTLPTTTTASKVTYVGCIYNSQDSFWDVVAVATQA